MKLKDKIIAFDIDGTLARNDANPSMYTYQEISKLVKKGYHICIVTGRQWASTYKIYHECHLNSACVLANGTLIYDPIKDFTFFKKQMTEEDLFNYVDDENLLNLVDDIMCEIGLTTYSLKGYHWKDDEIIGSFHETLKEMPCSINIMAKCVENQEKIKNILLQNPKYNYRFWILQGELYHQNFTKKEGIEALLKYYNKTKDDIIFFGDGENDIEALKYVKYGVAMKNATTKVKENADFVTDYTNDEDGAIKYLLKLIKEEDNND